VIAAAELGLYPVLDRAQPGFLKPGGIGPGERQVGDPGQRRAPPQAKRPAQPGSGRLSAAVRQVAPRRRRQPLEFIRVELPGGQPEQVA